MIYPTRSTLRALRGLAVLIPVVAASCAPGRPAVVAPVPDVETEAAALEAGTRLEGAVQVVFAWRANERGVRARGRGAARVAPPAKARLDLFLDNGETAVRAALVEAEIRLPPGASDDLLPPPNLLWGALGVARAGPDATLLGGDRLEDGSTRIRYGYPDGTELHFETASGVLTRVESLRGGRVVEEVRLTFDGPGGFPREATYRHLTDFRELHLVRESLEAVAAFPDEIWTPSR